MTGKNMINAVDDSVEKDIMLGYLSDLCEYPDIKIESSHSKIGETNIQIEAILSLPSGQEYHAKFEIDIDYLKAVPDAYNATVEMLLAQIGKEFMITTYKAREKNRNLPRVKNFQPILMKILDSCNRR